MELFMGSGGDRQNRFRFCKGDLTEKFYKLATMVTLSSLTNVAPGGTTRDAFDKTSNSASILH
jgi:hypothetical protein